VEAQQTGRVYRVGFLSLGARPTQHGLWKTLLDALRERNYVEGQNLIVRLALAEGRPERLPGLVAELMQAKVDVIVTTSTQETLAAKKATSTVPIVMTLVPDPVEQGLVASLARPGNNVTGLTTTSADAPRTSLTGSSRGRGPLTFPSSNPRSSSWCSTSPLRRRSA
jgi:putative ABC transport system substrate-binding protein